jgi:hypothetical protein
MRAPLIATASTALLALLLPVLLVAAALSSDSAGEAATGAPGDIPAYVVPLYRAASEAFGVHWLLLAAIHERETDFSRLDAPGVLSGHNGCGAAGPMQFGIVGVSPYNGAAPDCGALTGTGAGGTWARYRNAVDRLDGSPTTSRRPSCARVRETDGCVYDDRDAIAAAAAYLHDLGARDELDERAWKAARSYNGAAVYADAVLTRARQWQAEHLDDLTLTDPQTTPGARARVGADGLARAPENAPPEVKRAIAAANAISDKPYLLRHYPTHIGNPTYDCSSSSSHVLWGAGAFGTAPWVSGRFTTFGKPGPGAWVTVYANDGHMFLVVAGLRFDTARYDSGPNAGESGPRWRLGPRPTTGFAVRHPSGL